MSDKPCLHLHLSRIANMDLGEFRSSDHQGVFRCQECRNILIVRDIEPYRIKVVEGASKPHSKRKREIPIKEILADGTMVNMTKKEAAKWRKSIKSTIRDASGEVSDAG